MMAGTGLAGAIMTGLALFETFVPAPFAALVLAVKWRNPDFIRNSAPFPFGLSARATAARATVIRRTRTSNLVMVQCQLNRDRKSEAGRCSTYLQNTCHYTNA